MTIKDTINTLANKANRVLIATGTHLPGNAKNKSLYELNLIQAGEAPTLESALPHLRKAQELGYRPERVKELFREIFIHDATLSELSNERYIRDGLRGPTLANHFSEFQTDLELFEATDLKDQIEATRKGTYERLIGEAFSNLYTVTDLASFPKVTREAVDLYNAVIQASKQDFPGRKAGNYKDGNGDPISRKFYEQALANLATYAELSLSKEDPGIIASEEFLDHYSKIVGDIEEYAKGMGTDAHAGMKKNVEALNSRLEEKIESVRHLIETAEQGWFKRLQFSVKMGDRVGTTLAINHYGNFTQQYATVLGKSEEEVLAAIETEVKKLEAKKSNGPLMRTFDEFREPNYIWSHDVVSDRTSTLKPKN